MLFHVTANADWSNLPLSGLFVDMLRRLVALSVGRRQRRRAPRAGAGRDARRLRPAVGQPPPAAVGLQADKFAHNPALAAASAGLYGPENGRQALNLGTSIAAPAGRAADRRRDAGDGARIGAGTRAGAAVAGVRGAAAVRSICGVPGVCAACCGPRVSAAAACCCCCCMPAAHALDAQRQSGV